MTLKRSHLNMPRKILEKKGTNAKNKKFREIKIQRNFYID
jgi:hypothetical protein